MARPKTTNRKPAQTHAERSALSAQRLLAAAVELFAEKGFERTSAAEIGQRAGYSREMVRARYGSKDALVEALWEDVYGSYVLTEPGEDLTGLEQAVSQVETLRAMAADDPDRLRAFFVLSFETVSAASRHPWISHLLGAYEEAITDGLRRGREDGSVRGDLDPKREAQATVDQILGRGLRWVGAPDELDFARALGEVKRGLAARAGGDKPGKA